MIKKKIFFRGFPNLVDRLIKLATISIAVAFSFQAALAQGKKIVLLPKTKIISAEDFKTSPSDKFVSKIDVTGRKTSKVNVINKKTRKLSRIVRLKAKYSLDEDVSQLDGSVIRQKLERLLSRENIKIFLKTIRIAEGGEPGIMVGGKCYAQTLSRHPAETLPRRCRFVFEYRGRILYSTASGNYQLTLTTWRRVSTFLQLDDFSEKNQALAALELIRRGSGAGEGNLAIRRKVQSGFLALLNGDLEKSLCLATRDWASSLCSPLPGTKTDFRRIARKLLEGNKKNGTSR